MEGMLVTEQSLTYPPMQTHSSPNYSPSKMILRKIGVIFKHCLFTFSFWKDTNRFTSCSRNIFFCNDANGHALTWPTVGKAASDTAIPTADGYETSTWLNNPLPNSAAVRMENRAMTTLGMFRPWEFCFDDDFGGRTRIWSLTFSLNLC